MFEDSFTERINGFWFGKTDENGLCSPEKSSAWFKKDNAFDRHVEREFGGLLSLAQKGEINRMKETPRGALAFIILTDQFPRNIYRGLPESFSFDEFSLSACQKGMDARHDTALFPIERVFFYMPLMHSEDIEIQKTSVKTFSSLADEFRNSPEVFKFLSGSADFARRHFNIIEKFGRYPHRNEILGRKSTPEETEFLKQKGSSF